MKKFLENVQDYLEACGFTKLTDASTSYFFRKGKSLRIFPYGDYFFIHDSIYSEEAIRQQHDEDRAFVNKKYPIPRAWRWTVPNIASIFLFGSDIPESAITLTQLPVKDIWGGEIHAIILINLDKKIAHTVERVKYRLNVEGVSLPSRLPNKVDPIDRTNDVICGLVKNVSFSDC